MSAESASDDVVQIDEITNKMFERVGRDIVFRRVSFKNIFISHGILENTDTHPFYNNRSQR